MPARDTLVTKMLKESFDLPQILNSIMDLNHNDNSCVSHRSKQIRIVNFLESLKLGHIYDNFEILTCSLLASEIFSKILIDSESKSGAKAAAGTFSFLVIENY